MNDLREALLDAHVKFEISRLRGPALAKTIDERLTSAFAWLEGVKGSDIVTREMITGVIQRYAIDLKISGGITELAGEMANVVFSSKKSVSTRIGDVCETTSYEEFSDKIVTLEGAQREIIRYLVQSTAFGTLAGRVLSRVVLDLLFRVDEGERGLGLKELAVGLGQRVFPGFDQRLGQVLSRYVERHANRFTRDGEKHLLEAVDREWVRQMADEVWDAVSRRTLSDVSTVFTGQDLEDFVVLGYEFWLKFRKTPYFRAVVTEAVDHLFTKYGNESLASLIADMGVTKDMVARELVLFAEPAIAHAARTGFLEKELRALLEPFYRSTELGAVLASRR
jgi:hypothetical protein